MSEPLFLPTWPKGSQYISVGDAAELIDQCRRPPLDKTTAQKSNEDDQRKLRLEAHLAGNFDAYARTFRRESQNDPGLKSAVRKNYTVKEIVFTAKDSSIRLLRPTTEIPSFSEPDETFLIEEPGFRKIANILLWGDAAPREQSQRDRPNSCDIAVKTASDSETTVKPRRALYAPALNDWLAQQKLNVLWRSGPDQLAKNFVIYCLENRAELAPLLPKRPRSMLSAIERHIKNRKNKVTQRKSQ